MGLVKEFKEFALQGNVVDLAVGVVIGAAFGTIVSSFTDDVLTPLILSPALERAHLSNLEDLAWGAVKYGKFISAVLKFLIIAFCLFLIIKGINRMKRRKQTDAATAPAAPVYSTTEQLLMEIRDRLAK